MTGDAGAVPDYGTLERRRAEGVAMAGASKNNGYGSLGESSRPRLGDDEWRNSKPVPIVSDIPPSCVSGQPHCDGTEASL